MLIQRLFGYGLLLALGAGCSAAPGQAAPASTNHSTDSHADPVVLLSCNESELPPVAPLRRLSSREYASTLSNLFATNATLHGIEQEVALELSELPRDGESRGSFSHMDTRTSQRHIDTYLKVAQGIGRAVTNSDERLSALARACALGAELDAACFQRFVTDFGLRVFRRPLSDAEIGHFMELARGASAPRDAYRGAVTELFASPEFLFHVERGAGPAKRGWQELTAYELASRLAFHFWQTTPDDRLLEAAADGSLGTEAGYRAEVERLTGAQRAHATWYRFFREWFELEDFGGFSLDRAFENFAGNVKATPALYSDAVWEIEQLVGYYTFDMPGSYRDLLTSDLVVTRSPRLAALYEVEPWDGRSLPFSFPAGQRGGLLTRSALLMSASHATNPFHRGAFVRRKLLCEPIEPPAQRPPEAFVLPAFDPKASTRTRYERKVADGGCKGCHDLFSPYGYALEAYDALGRYREVERLIDDAGDAAGRVPVETKVSVPLEPGEHVGVDGPVELSQKIAESPLAPQCFARQYFRFTFRRVETAADSCTVNAILSSLKAGGLAAAYRDVAYSFAFRHKRVDGDQK